MQLYSSYRVLILHRAGAEKVRQVLRASTEVHTYAANDIRLVQCFFTLFRKNAFIQFLSSWSTPMQSVSAKKNKNRKNQSSEAGSDSYGSNLSFSRYPLREKGQTERVSSCETAPEKRKLEQCGCSARCESFDFFLEVLWLTRQSDWVLTLPFQ